MNGPGYLFDYNFQAVGQGLFAFGLLRRNVGGARFFQWVYDCGTSSSQELVDAAISRMPRPNQFYPPRLDLVVLSHFDRDHISGISKLVREYQIDTLMLPYVAQEYRLWMAFEENIPLGDDLMGFFVNPTIYLTTRGGPGGIKRILYVPPSGEQGPPPQPREPHKDFDPDKQEIWEMQRDDEEPTGRNDPALTVASPAEIRILRPKGLIRLQAFWEFVPYNDDPGVPIPHLFQLQVQSETNKFINSVSLQEREKALKQLKEIYEKEFG